MRAYLIRYANILNKLCGLINYYASILFRRIGGCSCYVLLDKWMFTFCSRFVLAEKNETRTNGEQRKNARTNQEHMVNIMITPTQKKCPVHLYIYITTVIYLPKILGVV